MVRTDGGKLYWANSVVNITHTHTQKKMVMVKITQQPGIRHNFRLGLDLEINLLGEKQKKLNVNQ